MLGLKDVQRLSVGLLAALLTVACHFPRTQVVLLVDGDSVVRREASEVVIQLRTANGTRMLRVTRSALEAHQGSFFPLRIPLSARDGGAWYDAQIEALKLETNGDVTVTTKLAQNRVRSGFRAGRVMTMPLWLLSGCSCTAAERCVPGPGFVPQCEPVDVDPEQQREEEPDPTGGRERSADAGVGDAREAHDGAATDAADSAVVTECGPGFHLCGTTCVPDGDVNSCGRRCEACEAVAGGTATCRAGACAVRCNGEREMCGAACIDVATSQVHCGRCDNPCSDGRICTDGFCVAPPECDTSNPARCPIGTYCNQGTCAVGCDESNDCGTTGICNSTTHECGCAGSARRCGGACAVCPPGAASTTCNAQNQCVASSCSAPQVLCSGACTMQSGAACGGNCETCAAAHGTPACINGSCTIASCEPGYRLCGGVCAICPSNASSTSCASDRCVATSCGSGLASCNGQCVPESTSQCGAACTACTAANGVATCASGNCTITSCSAGYRLCGGTCALCPSGMQIASVNCSNTSCRVASCSSGYQPGADGLMCEDVDECTVNNGGCDVHAMCTNTAGGRLCTCNAGYQGDGAVCTLTCTPNCNMRVCGADGCGGSCGTCASGSCNVSTGQCELGPLLPINGPVAPSGATNFGFSIALSQDGTTLAVGDDDGGGDANGAVTVYGRNGTGWSAGVAVARPSGALAFGTSVSLSANGNVLVVGDRSGGDSNGAVTVYQRNNGAWGTGTTLMRLATASQFGFAVSIAADGNTIAVGDVYGGSGALGTVQVYVRDGAGWDGQILVRPDSVSRFGTSVALSSNGSRLVVGDPDGGGGGGNGEVTVYTRVGDWDNGVTLDRPSGASAFGRSVAVSSDGNTIATGDTLAPGGGEVCVFLRTGSAWSRRTITHPTPRSSFGWSVAFSGDGTKLIVGDYAANNFGSTTPYSLAGTTWARESSLERPATARRFGYSIAASSNGALLAVGDPDNGSGIVSVFAR